MKINHSNEKILENKYLEIMTNQNSCKTIKKILKWSEIKKLLRFVYMLFRNIWEKKYLDIKLMESRFEQTYDQPKFCKTI